MKITVQNIVYALKKIVSVSKGIIPMLFMLAVFSALSVVLELVLIQCFFWDFILQTKVKLNTFMIVIRQKA